MPAGSGSAVVVRPVQLQDAAQLQANCLSQNTFEEVEWQIRDNLQAATEGRRLHLVAEVDGRVIGNAVVIRDQHPLRAHRAGLFSLVVSTPYQGRGIARRLVEEGCARAAAMGIEILETACRGGEPAEAVYPRLGFIEYGRLPHGLREPGGTHRVFDEVCFYRPTVPGPAAAT